MLMLVFVFMFVVIGWESFLGVFIFGIFDLSCRFGSRVGSSV